MNKIELKNLQNGNDEIKEEKNILSAELKDLRDKIYLNKDLLIKNENKLNIKVSEISQYKDNKVKIKILSFTFWDNSSSAIFASLIPFPLNGVGFSNKSFIT